MRTSRMAVLLAVAVTVLFGLGAYTTWHARAFSYMSDDPAACANCHIMGDSFASWGVSSHRGISCNDCHVPHDIVGKYVAKAESGFHHSSAFTLEDVQVPRATARTLSHIQGNCIRCHEPMVASIQETPQGELSCTHCHRGVGHVF